MLTIEFDLEDSFISDVITVALDPGYGGSLYWATAKKRVTRSNGDGSSMHVGVVVRITNVDDAGVFVDQDFIVDRELVERGIRWLMNDYVHVNSQIRIDIATAVMLKDAGHIDAEAADCIVQAGAFSTVMFG